MNIKNIISESIGWYGTAAIITAFALVSFEILEPTSFTYQILNGTGALGIVYTSLKKKTAHDRRSWQPAVLNMIWALIAIFALVKLFFYSN